MLIRLVVLYGMVLVALCAIWPVLQSFGVDRLPGDTAIVIGGIRVTVPLSSAALVSFVVSAALWATRRQR